GFLGLLHDPVPRGNFLGGEETGLNIWVVLCDLLGLLKALRLDDDQAAERLAFFIEEGTAELHRIAEAVEIGEVGRPGVEPQLEAVGLVLANDGVEHGASPQSSFFRGRRSRASTASSMEILPSSRAAVASII